MVLQNKVIIYSVNKSNIEFYKKTFSKLNCIASVVSCYADFENIILPLSCEMILLDLELDNTDAISVIKEIKHHFVEPPPFIVVCSNKPDDFIQISALNSGAHEFIDLPINALIFESKLKALCKRIHRHNSKPMNEGIFIDHEQYKVYVGHQSYSLPRLEFNLLSLLFSHPNKIFSKDEIANEIWSNREVSGKRTIDIHIRNIRKVIGEDLIKTYRGLGYSLRLNP